MKKDKTSTQLILLYSLLFFSFLYLTGCAPKPVQMLSSSQSALDPSVTVNKFIPITMKAHLMVVEVKINDHKKPYKFLLDTGGVTVFTEKTAADLDFTDETELSLTDISGNSKKVRLVTVERLGISGLPVSSLTAVVTDLDNFDPEIDGILGSNYFQYFRVDINYQKQSLTLSNGAFQNNTSAKVKAIPFEKNIKFGFAPMASCDVDGLTVPCMIDTGDPRNFTFPVAKLNKLPGYKNKQYVESDGSLLQGINGTKGNDVVVNVKQLKLASIQVSDFAMITNQTKEGIMTIGKDFLDNYQVSIDYPNSTLYLTQIKSGDESYPIFSYGFGFDKNERGMVKVKGIWPGSPGANAGIELGDEIVSINSTGTDNLSLLSIMKIFMEQPEIQVIFKKPSGEQNKVSLHREDLSQRVNR